VVEEVVVVRISIHGDREIAAKLAVAGPVIGTELDIAAQEARDLLEATAKSLAPVRTGRLKGAVHGFITRQAGLFVSAEGARGLQVSVGLRVDRREAPYGVWVLRGTGIYAGHEPWTVRARGKALTIPTVDGDLFRKSATIQGMRPRDFISDAVHADAEAIRQLFREAGARMTRKLG
jgi:hypothetical protein